VLLNRTAVGPRFIVRIGLSLAMTLSLFVASFGHNYPAFQRMVFQNQIVRGLLISQVGNRREAEKFTLKNVTHIYSG